MTTSTKSPLLLTTLFALLFLNWFHADAAPADLLNPNPQDVDQVQLQPQGIGGKVKTLGRPGGQPAFQDFNKAAIDHMLVGAMEQSRSFRQKWLREVFPQTNSDRQLKDKAEQVVRALKEFEASFETARRELMAWNSDLPQEEKMRVWARVDSARMAGLQQVRLAEMLIEDLQYDLS